MTKLQIPTVSEEVEQTQLFTWASWAAGAYPELPLMFHIPNGGHRNKATAAKLKAAGVKAGVPDIFLPVAKGGYFGLFIELKRADGGVVSSAQKEYLAALKTQGYLCAVAHGFDEAREWIEKYMQQERTAAK